MRRRDIHLLISKEFTTCCKYVLLTLTLVPPNRAALYIRASVIPEGARIKCERIDLITKNADHEESTH